MTYQIIPKFIQAHKFNGDIGALQAFIDQTGGAAAMALPKPQFVEDAIITSTQENNSTSIKIKDGQYIVPTGYDFFETYEAADFEAKYQPVASD